jgi:hypothetical protein
VPTPNLEHPRIFEIFELLRREIVAQPAKAAVLIGLILLAGVIWGPRLAGTIVALGRSSSGADFPGSQSSVQAAQVLGTSPSIPANVSKPEGYLEKLEIAGEEKSEAISSRVLPWLAIVEQMLKDPTLQPAWALAEQSNPFQPGVPGDHSLDSAGKNLPPASPEGATDGKNPEDLPVEKLLPPLKALLIAGDTRAAIIGETLYVLRPGEKPPKIKVASPGDELTVELLAIEPNGVVLQFRDKRFELRFSSGSSGAEIREVSPFKATAEKDDAI